PAYTDKYARQGIRAGDLLASNFMQMYSESKKRHLKLASLYCNNVEEIRVGKNLTLQEYEKQWLESLDLLRSFRIGDTEYLLHDALLKGKKILAEGAQGAMLDIDFGSYPYVTSSNTIAAGVSSGLGVAPGRTGKVFGVFKAYCTRVGSGPFPTELHDSDGELMRQRGGEFGATTGRPRRCGWLDLPAISYAAMLNGVTNLIMMKADVLSVFPAIKICTAYRVQNAIIERFGWQAQYNSPEPIYSEMPGWQSDIAATESLDQLPPTLKGFISFIEKTTGTDIAIVSTGPGRTQTLAKEGFPSQ
ncbi:MAG TPA: adenylosuccinate synthetase, partial [Bacteroidales bacterium]|nr:adenylosuccinate synthetase [Bacteroidales bacterium]